MPVSFANPEPEMAQPRMCSDCQRQARYAYGRVNMCSDCLIDNLAINRIPANAIVLRVRLFDEALP